MGGYRLLGDGRKPVFMRHVHLNFQDSDDRSRACVTLLKLYGHG